jgi:hypothetical protein
MGTSPQASRNKHVPLTNNECPNTRSYTPFGAPSRSFRPIKTQLPEDGGHLVLRGFPSNQLFRPGVVC